MVEKITLLDEKGESFQSDIVAVFNADGKKILVTTNNEPDPNGLTILNVSEVVNDTLQSITDEEFWKHPVQDIMRSIVAGGDGVDFQPVIENANVNKASYYRAISVQADAVKVMKDTYTSKRPVASPNVNEAAVAGATETAVNDNMFNGNVASTVPGVAEQTPTDFQQVSNLGNPVDLMDSVMPGQATDQTPVELPASVEAAQSVGTPAAVEPQIPGVEPAMDVQIPAVPGVDSQAQMMQPPMPGVPGMDGQMQMAQQPMPGQVPMDAPVPGAPGMDGQMQMAQQPMPGQVPMDAPMPGVPGMDVQAQMMQSPVPGQVPMDTPMTGTPGMDAQMQMAQQPMPGQAPMDAQTGQTQMVDPTGVAISVSGEIGQVDPEIIGYLQNLNATVINIFEVMKQQQMQKFDARERELEQKEQQLQYMQAGMVAQANNVANMSNMALNQSMMGVPAMQQPMAPGMPGQMMGQGGLDPNMMNQSMMGQTPMTDPNMAQFPQQAVEPAGPSMGYGQAA